MRCLYGKYDNQAAKDDREAEIVEEEAKLTHNDQVRVSTLDTILKSGQVCGDLRIVERTCSSAVKMDSAGAYKDVMYTSDVREDVFEQCA